MCLKKWFGKDEVVEEVPVERKPVDELVQAIQDLVAQLNLVVEDNKKLEERIKILEEEKYQEYLEACDAKDQVNEILLKKITIDILKYI